MANNYYIISLIFFLVTFVSSDYMKFCKEFLLLRDKKKIPLLTTPLKILIFYLNNLNFELFIKRLLYL